jgi:D-alanyl-D-alanine dipeptidase
MKQRFSLFLASLVVAVALHAQQGPPADPRATRTPDLVELVKIIPTIKLDVKYATDGNWAKRKFYDQPRAFLQRPAALALQRAQAKLLPMGYSLLVFDGYRPWRITKQFWDLMPDSLKHFVANPAEGSKHNRGCAVDISLFDLKTGREVPMPSAYDETTERAYPTYTGGTPENRRLRDLLRATLEAEGFAVYQYEWWHFDYRDWQLYPVLDIPFDKL